MSSWQVLKMCKKGHETLLHQHEVICAISAEVKREKQWAKRGSKKSIKLSIIFSIDWQLFCK